MSQGGPAFSGVAVCVACAFPSLHPPDTYEKANAEGARSLNVDTGQENWNDLTLRT